MTSRTNIARWIESAKRWQINVQKNGKRKTFTCSTPGRKGQQEANRKADEWLSGLEASPSTKVSTLWDEFAKFKLLSSEDEYNKIVSFGKHHFLPAHGHKRISALTELDLQNTLLTAYNSPKGNFGRTHLSRKTLQNYRSFLLQFVRFCRKKKATTLFIEDLQIPNGARYLGKTILQPQHLLVVFNVDTTVLYGKRTKDDFWNAYRLQLVTGLRPGELRGLEWDDIHGREIHLRRSINCHDKVTRGKNENAIRTVPLTKLALQILDEQRQVAGDFKMVFPEITSEERYYSSWKRYQSANGLPGVSLYEMRHTFVSMAKNLPEGSLKQLIGHSKDMDTYGVYSHPMDGDTRNTADQIDNILEALLTPPSKSS